MYKKIFKPFTDFIIALLFLIVLFPLIIFIALLVKITSAGPVFYRAPRGGYKNKTFYIMKFRTMVRNADKIGSGTTALNDRRITKVGKFLRKTKLDEIPQLFNILAFQMSFIGPRPELLKYTDLYNEDERKILSVRPGITDYSSIRYAALDEIVGQENAEEVFEKSVLAQKNILRLEYVADISLITDLKIFFITVFVVVGKMFFMIFPKKHKPKMEYVRLKNSKLRVSRICMGGCPMGEHGWGEVSKNDLIEAVHVALKNGINFFDTADTYGLGTAEKTLGEALGKNRRKVVIATKFGVRFAEGKSFYDNSPEWIMEACEASLKRLNTKYIDLYQVHYRDGVTPLADVVNTLRKLKKMGKIKYYGLSNIHEADLEEISKYKHEFVSFQDEYSLACRKNERDLLLLSKDLSLTPLTWGSLGQGILTGKYDKNSVFEKNDRRSRDVYVNFHEKLEKNLEIVEKMREMSAKINRNIPSIAIRFILDFIPESVIIVGIKNKKQLLANIEAIGWKLTAEEIAELDSVSKEE